MNCENARDVMDALFVGDADAASEAALRAHLPTCQSCGERYERLARVDAVLANGELSPPRLEQLEARIFAAVPHAPSPPQPEPSWLRSRGWALALAVATVAVVVGVPAWRASHEDPFTPKGPGTEAWGVRAFCVGPDATVTAEALAGGTLRCPPGSSVQFTYTAPRDAQLGIALTAGAQRLFPGEGSAGSITAGTDVPLPLSTPVGDWLAEPQQVTVRFTDPAGALLSESTLQLSPR